MRFLEFLDFRIGIPLFSVHFIAADMKIVVGKKFGQLADQFVEKFVSFFVGGIHCGIKYAPLAFNRVRTRAAGEFGIADEPGSAVAGHIEFGNDANAAITRVTDEVAHFILRVVETVRA